MGGNLQIFLGGAPAEESIYDRLSAVEVEENVDMPSACQLTFSIGTDANGDLTCVNDSRLGPLAELAIVTSADGETSHCIFDGVVLSHKLHLDSGTILSTLQVWAQDATWPMNLEEKAHEWVDVTDADVAASIFGDYGITPSPENRADDSPSHTEDKHTLMQRASDIQFLRMLARRNGKLCRVACTDTPGQRTGYFAKANLDGDPAVRLTLNDPVEPKLAALDFEWDVSRPSAVTARQALFDDPSEDGVSGDTAESGLTLLDERGLADFAGTPMTVILTTPVDDAGELTLRAQSVLRESGWFARCEGEVDAGRINAVIRAGSIVQIDDAGTLNSGKYFVWSVRHSLTDAAHRMRFVLVRNAVGPEASGGGLS
jgi:phage protein D